VFEKKRTPKFRNFRQRYNKFFKCKKEDLALIMESKQMFILMKNCTKIGLKLNKQMVSLTDINV